MAGDATHSSEICSDVKLNTIFKLYLLYELIKND